MRCSVFKELTTGVKGSVWLLRSVLSAAVSEGSAPIRASLEYRETGFAGLGLAERSKGESIRAKMRKRLHCQSQRIVVVTKCVGLA